MPRTGLTPAELRSRAIEAALARIRAHGFEKVRLTEVAHDLGVSHAALYAHFENKEALLDAVIEAWLTEMSGTLDRVCTSNVDPLERIERWFVAQYVLKRKRARSDRAVYAAFASASVAGKPFVSAYLQRRAERLVTMVEAIGAPQGPRQPRAAAAVLLAGMDGFLHPRIILDGAGRNREPELRRVLSTLLRGLEAGSGSLGAREADQERSSAVGHGRLAGKRDRNGRT